MRSWQETLVPLAGAITSILTVVALVLCEQWFELRFFSVMHWFVIPTGAICSGIVAASGIYFASVWLHTRPTRALLWQMVLIAAVTQMLVYYVQYLSVELEDGTALADVASFGAYLSFTLGNAQYSFGSSKSGLDIGRVGYVFAGIQFLGFLAGGMVPYVSLQSKRACERCQKYYRELSHSVRKFETPAQFQAFQSRLECFPPFSESYLAQLREPHERSLRNTKAGAVDLHVRLLECPGCKDQKLLEQANVFNGSQWKELEPRVLGAPQGVAISKADLKAEPGAKAA